MIQKMKAIRIHDYGEASVLKYEDVDVPQIGADEVLVKIAAASVNPMDWKVRSGMTKNWMQLKFPAILGIDAAGTVEQVGSDVKKFKKGDKVFGRADFTKGGSYAEYAAITEKQLAHAPKKLSMEETAGLPVTFGTAWNALLEVAQLKKGQHVLILGASGGVGTAAVQIAKSVGAHVIGTTSAENAAMVKSIGADEVIDYTKEDVASKAKDVDVVFDTVGGDTLKQAYQYLKKGGVLVTIAGQPDEELAKKYEISVKTASGMNDGTGMEQLAKLADEGKIKVVIGSRFKLADMQKAHQLSESKKAKGKIIVNIA